MGKPCIVLDETKHAGFATMVAGIVIYAVSRPCEAMDGRARAYMDVLVACLGTA